jgi:hypothetical protein
MPTIAEVRSQFPQYDDLSDADLASALHAKYYADMPADQFAEKIGLKPDKYQQAAADELAALKEKGIDPGTGLTARLVHGATLGADSTIVAGALAPIEAYKRGVGLGEGYSYAKAREDEALQQARANTGLAGTAAELLGGGVTGGGLARGGLTASRLLSANPGLVARTAASAADAAGLGGIAGFNEGNGLADRFSKAGQGALTGAAIGGALPVAGAIAGGVASPFVSNIMARINPEGYAQRQVARAVIESGRPINDIAGDVTNAANEGQGVYTVADALGNPGQRMLSAVARAPGEGRTDVVNALEARQGMQGRRVSNALAEGFNTPETAAQTEARLTAARGAEADAAYGAVRNDANPVDVVGTINHIDRIIGTEPGQVLATPNDSIEATLRGFRERLSRVNPDDFAAVQRIRGEMADQAQSAMQSGYGNRARLIRGAVNQLDRSMEDASAGHLQANRNFAQASRDIQAVQTGRDAALRGRTEDTIPAFQGLRPEAQQAFRSGYVDPLIAQTQGAAFGVNKARPLLNDAFAAEADAMAPGNPLMQRRLAREQTMFETRNAALGGSKTADNLADADALGIDPSVVGHVISGNWGGAVRSLIHAGSRAITGNTPQVRQAVANILLQHGANVTPAQLDQLVGQTVQRIQFVQQLAQNAGRVAGGAAAVATNRKSKPSIFPNRRTG